MSMAFYTSVIIAKEEETARKSALDIVNGESVWSSLGERRFGDDLC